MTPGFESLVLCPAFIDFEFMNWTTDGASGEACLAHYVDFMLCAFL